MWVAKTLIVLFRSMSDAIISLEPPFGALAETHTHNFLREYANEHGLDYSYVWRQVMSHSLILETGEFKNTEFDGPARNDFYREFNLKYYPPFGVSERIKPAELPDPNSFSEKYDMSGAKCERHKDKTHFQYSTEKCFGRYAFRTTIDRSFSKGVGGTQLHMYRGHGQPEIGRVLVSHFLGDLGPYLGTTTEDHLARIDRSFWHASLICKFLDSKEFH